MEERDDVQLVRALVDNPAANVDYNRKFDGIEQLQLRRKDQHDAAIQSFQRFLATLSEELESDVS